MPHCETHKFTHAVQVELVHDSSAVPVDGIGTQVQKYGKGAEAVLPGHRLWSKPGMNCLVHCLRKNWRIASEAITSGRPSCRSVPLKGAAPPPTGGLPLGGQ